MTIESGLKATVDLRVTEADTAVTIGSGDVPVLATPRLVALCEEASCAALAGHLPDGATSVAKRVQFDHLAPIGTGNDVRAEASLDRVEGRRLTFTVSVSSKEGLVGAGKVTRVIVDRRTFLERAR